MCLVTQPSPQSHEPTSRPKPASQRVFAPSLSVYGNQPTLSGE